MGVVYIVVPRYEASSVMYIDVNDGGNLET